MAILYFYVIQLREEVPDQNMRYFRLGSRCQAQIESTAAKGSLMERFGFVLQELRVEVLRIKSYLDPRSAPRPQGFPRSGEAGSDLDAHGPRAHGNPVVGRAARGSQLAEHVAANAANSMDSFDSALLNMPGWGQFDSLVMLTLTIKKPTMLNG